MIIGIISLILIIISSFVICNTKNEELYVLSFVLLSLSGSSIIIFILVNLDKIIDWFRI